MINELIIDIYKLHSKWEWVITYGNKSIAGTESSMEDAERVANIKAADRFPEVYTYHMRYDPGKPVIISPIQNSWADQIEEDEKANGH